MKNHPHVFVRDEDPRSKIWCALDPVIRAVTLVGELRPPGRTHEGGKSIWRRPGCPWHPPGFPRVYRDAHVHLVVHHLPEDRALAVAAAVRASETFLVEHGASQCTIELVVSDDVQVA